jgi:hypothetical protein
MLIKQLSVFLENKQGKFAEIAGLLGEKGVNMKAFTVSESSDFGIARFIVDDTERALSVLRAASYAVTATDVVYLKCPNVPGAMALAMKALSKAGVFIEYMYAYADDGHANLVIRSNDDDTDKCDQIISSL